mmetsp:Transcript_19740/g.29711  ORF Transcript_19740/g.29711 Transcript_19740/m.29711 type:complete len:120 (-) Transcript_19740:481-840(-)|eukprot:scaffold15011_cov89-Skeletonema_dohrnii-CCMP3373.AAC.1
MPRYVHKLQQVGALADIALLGLVPSPCCYLRPSDIFTVRAHTPFITTFTQSKCSCLSQVRYPKLRRFHPNHLHKSSRRDKKHPNQEEDEFTPTKAVVKKNFPPSNLLHDVLLTTIPNRS